jgi:hypothetical protein
MMNLILPENKTDATRVSNREIKFAKSNNGHYSKNAKTSEPEHDSACLAQRLLSLILEKIA